MKPGYVVFVREAFMQALRLGRWWASAPLGLSLWLAGLWWCCCSASCSGYVEKSSSLVGLHSAKEMLSEDVDFGSSTVILRGDRMLREW